MDQPRNANARSDLGNTPSTFNMYIVICEISSGKKDITVSGYTGTKDPEGGTLGLIITTNEIVHNIRVPNTFCNLFFVADVPFLPSKHMGERRNFI